MVWINLVLANVGALTINVHSSVGLTKAMNRLFYYEAITKLT